MKLFEAAQTREEYLDTQIQRSREKFKYCKVSYNHVLNWRSILEKEPSVSGPILCLGSRNGREVDMFRTVFQLGTFVNYLVKKFERNVNGWKSRYPFLESIGRSDKDQITEKSVIGVELNPDGCRPDVVTASFDEMPQDWESKFGVLYSNSFDQSLDPHKTAKEWIRVAKNNALIIIGFNDAEPTFADPTGGLLYSDFLELFPGELIYFRKSGSNYDDIIIRLKK